ncbi:MAG: Na+/H+ antiporter NhaC, partial [Wenzhouxiangella sp.]|nr:Na+/H+ antiporter NhaC [Wenzhouxiangella sp.]
VATIPILALVIFLGVNIFLFQGDPHIPLVLATAVTALVGWRLKCSWEMMENGLVKGIEIGLKPILILLVVGILIGTWIMSGIVPTIIYYGLQVFDPKQFLAATCLICAIVSLSTGSSWTTAGTIGVAMIGVGNALGVPSEMVAGAIVSGAYVGDKMSPLSDTTNLAPAVAGAELFEHIRYMTLTAVPAFLISLVIYGIMGLMITGDEVQGDKIQLIQETLSAHFNLNPLLLLPPLLVVLMVVFRVPALPALAAGAALGGVLAMLFQGSSPESIIGVAHYGYEPVTQVEAVDELLKRGGLDSMMFTVSLILCALSFGGLMEATGMLAAIAESVLKMAHTTGRLIASTVLTCVGMNILAPDQYLSIAVPGRMYKDAY